MFKPKSEITSPIAKKMFSILINELEVDGNLSERTLMLVDNIVLLEQLKRSHLADIKKRGAVEFFEQGSQRMWRDNKSVDKVLKIVEQQRKLQAELKLTPASDRKVAGLVKSGDSSDEAEKGDDFEKF